MPLQGDQMALAHHAPPKEDSGPRAAFDIWTHLVQRVSMLFSNVTHLPYILHNTKTPVKLTRRLLFSVHDVFSPQQRCDQRAKKISDSTRRLSGPLIDPLSPVDVEIHRNGKQSLIEQPSECASEKVTQPKHCQSWVGQLLVRVEGKTRVLHNISSHHSVEAIKQRVPGAERLLFAGKNLHDTSTLAACGIPKEATLDVLGRLFGGGRGSGCGASTPNKGVAEGTNVIARQGSSNRSAGGAGSSSDTRRQTTTSDADALRAKDSEIAALHHRIKQLELLAHTASNPSLYLQVSLPAVGQGVLEQGAVGKMEGRDFNDRVRSSVPQAGGADSGDRALEATSKGTSKAGDAVLTSSIYDWTQEEALAANCYYRVGPGESR
eukprot:CAMPEP_0179461068 /NCGR_PEP_ID=MMETSP0799-20121207/43903_1 /TAXON_ID=46947 /ORGANISM="Geminigera cryophila, Strain CCMP2564" /LENGTH=377 /DNA_ID=CAMNT_0021263519 /DNA_START=42 /DNA_END=1175 /DNA_ORIENTATION=-